jgi:hypothetical protein
VLRLFLPESWTSKRARLDQAGVPDEYRMARTKPEIALGACPSNRRILLAKEERVRFCLCA